ncbi:MAG TPA: ferritin-like domain-containing protein [Acidobacteriaceae bacterium]|jgi:ferritin-like metal-binding protein YciE
MSVETAQDLFIDELKDIYSAEKQAVKAYPRLVKVVQSEDLKEAMQKHLEQTKQQVERLDRVFEIMQKRATGKTCEGMKGLLDEAAAHVEQIEKGPVLDAALIGALQRVEHYEIAAYGTVATFAEAMGQNEIHALLAQTLQEEKDTDEKLTEVSKDVNSEAFNGQDEEEEDEESNDRDEDGDEEEEEPASKRSAAKSAQKGKRKR